MTQTGLDALFEPRSIAIFGASREPGSMGQRALANLRKGGFSGELVPINPRHAGQSPDGLHWYRSASEYGAPIDHAVILVRADAVAPLIEDCVAAQVRSISILSGGFAETDDEGQATQARIRSLTREAGIRLLGPNCLGFVNTRATVYASPASVFEVVWPGGGPVAIVSQSGAVAADLLARADEQGLKAGFWVSTGNEADIAVSECIDYVCQLQDIRAIALYLESIHDIEAFRRAVRRARAQGKHIIAIRPGRTPAGVNAVQSHTAAIVTADRLYDAVFRQLGIIRVDSQRELIDAVKVALWTGKATGGLAITTSSGGNGAMAADAAYAGGVPLACISPEGQRRMRELVPACSPGNPIDMTGATNQNPAMLPEFFDAVLSERSVDCMMMIHGSSMLWRDRAEKITAALLGAATKFPHKRLAFVGMIDDDLADRLARAAVPVFDDAVALLRAMALFGAEGIRSMRTASATGNDTGGQVLDEDLALDVLQHRIGVPVVDRALIQDRQSLDAQLARLGFPVAMKAVIAGVTHKTEIGAVRVGLSDSQAAHLAWQALAEICLRHGAEPKILVESMVTDTVSEFLLSAFVDPLLGPFVTVGAGGTLTERMNDVTVAPAPVSPTEAAAMLRRLRGWEQMTPHRNGSVGNEEELIAAIVAVAQAIGRAAHGAGSDRLPARPIELIEVNPFMLRPRGSCAVDAVIGLRADPGPETAPGATGSAQMRGPATDQ